VKREAEESSGGSAPKLPRLGSIYTSSFFFLLDRPLGIRDSEKLVCFAAGENTKRKGSTGGFVADSVEGNHRPFYLHTNRTYLNLIDCHSYTAPEPPLDLGFSLRAAWSALDRGITADAVLQGLRHNRQPVPESSAPKSPLSPGAIACLICEVNEATTSLKPKGSHRCLCAHCLKFTAEAPDLHLCKVCKEEPSKKFSKST
jgi:hypothetical protein